MAWNDPAFITVRDLVIAYKKAKTEAFYQKGHFTATNYLSFEENLHNNLSTLLVRLNSKRPNWIEDLRFLGGHTYCPKRIDENQSRDAIHYCHVDTLDEWNRRFRANQSKRAKAEFRQLITPTVFLQIISALWIIKAGHKYEQALDRKYSYAYRLRRRRLLANGEVTSKINLDSSGLYEPYFTGYKRWREGGLSCMRRSLKQGVEIAAVTMDLERFFHNIDPTFLLNNKFISLLSLNLSEDEIEFTKQFVNAITFWYKQSPDYNSQSKVGLPIGLSASKLIANVLLKEFDDNVAKKLKPLYYGRYVDDVFLVIKGNSKIKVGSDMLRFISNKMSPEVRFVGKPMKNPSIRFCPSYSKRSRLRFKGKKQKIFLLKGKTGLDLVDHIAEQIRKSSSEYRLFPILPESESEMASQALLATPDSNLEADALRKAESVSLKRLGFTLLLRDVETYAQALNSSSWQAVRYKFFGLVRRHLLTPYGYFSYNLLIHRVFRLMIVTKDYQWAMMFLADFDKLASLIRKTTTAGSTESSKMNLCTKYYKSGFAQSFLEGLVDFDSGLGDELKPILSSINKMNKSAISLEDLNALRTRFVKADLSWMPYKEYWVQHATSDEEDVALNERSLRFFKRFILRSVRRITRKARKHVFFPYWPALAFPTRPLSVAEITNIAPTTLRNVATLKQLILALRGAGVRSGPINLWRDEVVPSGVKSYFNLPHKDRGFINIALTSFETTEHQFSAALNRRDDLSKDRFVRFCKLFNEILTNPQKAEYIVLPECSVPYRWAMKFARTLAENRVSLVAGLEHRIAANNTVHNEAFVSMVTRWPGYRSFVAFRQPKVAPSYEELREIKAAGKEFSVRGTTPIYQRFPIYIHGNFCFGIIICSDLTNIANRCYFQGEVDCLFILEWNKDTETFDFLVESSAHDLHAFIVQSNNRLYGDSRIRAPYAERFRRDIIRVKGGLVDYFIMARIDFHALRSFQRNKADAKGEFKPVPVGFAMSKVRREGFAPIL